MSVAIKLLKDGCGRVEVPDGWRGVGKRQKERARASGPFLFARS